MKNCIFKDCKEKHYGKGYCRKHYRRTSGESQKRWQKVKGNTTLHDKQIRAFKQWYEEVKNTDKYNKYQKRNWRRWYLGNKEHFREYLRKWKKELPTDKKKEYRQKDNATRQFGSWKLRESIIQRDDEKCTHCGTTREEHKKQWNQDLHVDHKDNYGRNVIHVAKNNDPENLETLCIRCHRKKSAKEQWNEKREELLIYGKDFTEELKEKVRELATRVCEDCGKTEEENRRKLDVHHKNGNKKDNQLKNLRALCAICHQQAEQRVKSTRLIIQNG